MPYDCEVIFRKGKAHTNVDALSRLIEVNHDKCNTESFKLNNEVKASLSMDSNETLKKDTIDIFEGQHLLTFVKSIFQEPQTQKLKE